MLFSNIFYLFFTNSAALLPATRPKTTAPLYAALVFVTSPAAYNPFYLFFTNSAALLPATRPKTTAPLYAALVFVTSPAAYNPSTTFPSS